MEVDMMTYVAFMLLAASVAVAAKLAARAIREEYLLVLHWREHGLWVFERADDGRYGRIPLGALPVALLRYAWRTWFPRPLAVRMPGRTPAADTA
jgi:hypothetical protein